MEVIKVVVDELPSDCASCDFAEYGSYADGGFGKCYALNRSLDLTSNYIRPDWCPLVTEGSGFDPDDPRLHDHLIGKQ